MNILKGIRAAAMQRRKLREASRRSSARSVSEPPMPLRKPAGGRETKRRVARWQALQG